METPGAKEEFREDEDMFIDRSATVTTPCVVADTGAGDGHGAPAAGRSAD